MQASRLSPARYSIGPAGASLTYELQQGASDSDILARDHEAVAVALPDMDVRREEAIGAGKPEVDPARFHSLERDAAFSAHPFDFGRMRFRPGRMLRRHGEELMGGVGRTPLQLVKPFLVAGELGKRAHLVYRHAVLPRDRGAMTLDLDRMRLARRRTVCGANSPSKCRRDGSGGSALHADAPGMPLVELGRQMNIVDGADEHVKPRNVSNRLAPRRPGDGGNGKGRRLCFSLARLSRNQIRGSKSQFPNKLQ
jgi:hypothetical protein